MWRSTRRHVATRSYDPPRYLMAGADRAGNLLELVVIDLNEEVLAIHAMKLRRNTEQELFGGKAHD